MRISKLTKIKHVLYNGKVFDQQPVSGDFIYLPVNRNLQPDEASTTVNHRASHVYIDNLPFN